MLEVIQHIYIYISQSISRILKFVINITFQNFEIQMCKYIYIVCRIILCVKYKYIICNIRSYI
jgi:hypothetical protein